MCGRTIKIPAFPALLIISHRPSASAPAASETNDATQTGKPPPPLPPVPRAFRRSPDSFACPLHADLTGRAVSGGRQPAPFGLLRGSRPRALGLEAGGEGPGAFSRVPSRVGLREERRGPQRPSMAERRPIYREPGKPRRPPRSQGSGNFSVPLWEKKFCTDACAIPWAKLCETKRLMSLYKSVVDWDDSAALEAFNEAKARFCAVYHGQHYDIPLPDPSMFIDIINPDEYVDPELVSDLEKSRCRVPRKDNGVPDVWDSFIFSDKPVPVTGWGDTETSFTHGQQLSANWDNQLKHSVEANKLMLANWDYSVKQPAQTIDQQNSGNWEVYEEQQDQTSSWGEQTNPCITNWIMRDGSQGAWKHDYSWAPAAIQTDPWDNHQGSYEVPDSQGVSYGHWTHWRRRNNDLGRRNTRNRGGPISSKPMKSKYQTDEHNGANNGWRNCRVRNDMHYYSYEQADYTKQQSLAM